MNYDELIPGCSLHHFNLSGIDISLLNNKASKQLLHKDCKSSGSVQFAIQMLRKSQRRERTPTP